MIFETVRDILAKQFDLDPDSITMDKFYFRLPKNQSRTARSE